MSQKSKTKRNEVWQRILAAALARFLQPPTSGLEAGAVGRGRRLPERIATFFNPLWIRAEDAP